MKEILVFLFSTCVSMIGYTIHGSIFWCILDFIFAPIAVAKWLVCQEITLAIIKQTFAFFL